MHCRASVQQGYTPYGYCSHPVSLLVFNGEYLTPLNGHCPLGAGRRCYRPALMRFTRPDSLSPFGAGGMNAYAYVLGDPVNVRDPSGHVPEPGFYYKGPVDVVNGLRVFMTKNSAGKSILNIGAHGKPGGIGNRFVTDKAAKVASILKKHHITLDGQETHVLACYSADRPPGGSTSFIEDLANITQAPSTGYKGPMWTDDNRPHIVNGRVEHYWIKIVTHMDENDRDFARFAYEPVRVEPSVASAAASHNQAIRRSH